MDKCCKFAALYLATLRAMSIIHQYNHWTTKGENFYGDHLLFERLYDAVLKRVDAAAERFIGLFGDECVGYDFQVELLNKVLLKYKNLEGSPVQMSMAIEKDFLKLAKDAYDCFEKEGRMTMGLDDMVMSMCSDSEEAIYLLKQTLNEGK